MTTVPKSPRLKTWTVTVEREVTVIEAVDIEVQAATEGQALDAATAQAKHVREHHWGCVDRQVGIPLAVTAERI